MARAEINDARIAAESGCTVSTVEKAIVGATIAPRVIDALTCLLGIEFDRLWHDYPNHTTS